MTETPGLRRSLSLVFLIFYGLGNIVGAGIYVLVGKVAGVAGMYAPLSFLIACLLAMFTAFSYAELSARYPVSAGEAVYIDNAFHKRFLSVTVALLIVLGGMLSSAAILRGFSGYLALFKDLPAEVSIIGVALLLCTLAVWGIRESVGAAALITLMEIVGLLLVLWAGRENLAEMPGRFGELVPPLDGNIWYGIFFGGLLAFYAFIGFEDMVNVAEEVEDPEKNMPRSIIGALVIATVLYMAIAVLAVFSVSPEVLHASDAPLVMVYNEVGGRYPEVLGTIAMFAVTNGVLIQIIMSSRILYGLGRQRMLPDTFSNVLAKVHPVTRTPIVATVLVTLIVIVLSLGGRVEKLAEHASFVILMVFVFINASLWKIKLQDPHPVNVKTFPVWMPVAGLITSSGFVLFEVYNLLK